MPLSMSNGASGASFFQEALEVVTNNIASMERPGFKEELLVGSSNPYQQRKGVGTLAANNGALLPVGVQIGQGVKSSAVVSKLSDGSLQRTDNQYHMAIRGRGFFQVELPNGQSAYTRDGTFAVNSEGVITTQMGNVVAPAITVPQNAEYISISRTGEVMAKTPDQVELINLGNIETVTFVNEEGLRKIEDNLLLETEASGVPVAGTPGEDQRGHILQGYYESSNVDMVSQVTKLIQIQRAYEMNVKGITTYKEMMGRLDQI